MANKHYRLDEEFEVTIKVKVKLESCSDYQHVSNIRLEENVEDFKSEIGNHLKGKLTNYYGREEVTDNIDDWTFEVL